MVYRIDDIEDGSNLRRGIPGMTALFLFLLSSHTLTKHNRFLHLLSSVQFRDFERGLNDKLTTRTTVVSNVQLDDNIRI